ncbi:hypothetical protein L596_003885 [Steinernema carpocapsae]|uniref:Uncharacterized protein n=1 Tax=Steinernema carpocapsae TaxID=34508 RepID=A0A4U8UV17_STECR|nr:hypothetical protein L596_003885 [Steinernema carpocapsae]
MPFSDQSLRTTLGASCANETRTLSCRNMACAINERIHCRLFNKKLLGFLQSPQAMRATIDNVAQFTFTFETHEWRVPKRGETSHLWKVRSSAGCPSEAQVSSRSLTGANILQSLPLALLNYVYNYLYAKQQE